ncbi:hypothetical protein [Phaeobacter porticola]|uniref:Uncharacterized protein n=1 Tax=Phaeobacter porticola TaxID=1844006 RepID=A0A1L3I617_9RHOB|nr:hypothetical protein [Phaeobacter porticola]APG47558.1 hypothetical protein PhaeoP97_02158 [Phaeobacter porticola]
MLLDNRFSHLRQRITHAAPKIFLALVLTLVSTTASTAQNKYDAFWGQFMAAALIADTCRGVQRSSGHGAVSIGVASDGLREQRLLRVLYYGNEKKLTHLGHTTLAMSNVSTDEPQNLCRFARKVARTDDKIGRFLRVN